MATSIGLGPFSRRMDFRARELGRDVDRVVRSVALAADQAVVFATPVDKGVARSNWRVSVGTPSVGTIGAYSPGDGLGIGEAANAQAAIAQALAAIAARRPGQSIFIVNNLPYIQRLNDGSSAQAPAGFVEAAVAEASSVVARARLLRSP